MTCSGDPLQPGAVTSERIRFGARCLIAIETRSHRLLLPVGESDRVPPKIQPLAARLAGVLRTSMRRTRSSVSQAHGRSAFPTNLGWDSDWSKLKERNSRPLYVYDFCFYLPDPQAIEQYLGKLAGIFGLARFYYKYLFKSYRSGGETRKVSVSAVL